jgi:hypothetical protein
MNTKRDIPTITNQKEVDEELIRAAAALIGNGSSFHRALAIAEEYKKAGLTPMYIMDDQERNIYVTTTERMANGLN